MTGIPDAVVEAAADALLLARRDGVPPPPFDRDDIEGDWLARMWHDCYDEARAALEAAEGPWREHLATQTCCQCPRHSHQCTSYCQGHQ